MMQINVSEILSTSGKSQSFQAEPGFDFVPYSGVEYPVAAKESFALSVSNIGKKKIRVTGETKVVLLIPCDRCLNDVSVEFPIKIDVVIDRTTEDDDEKEWNDIVLSDGIMLEVDMLVYDEIAANFPMKTLCKEDCKGLCPKCGKPRREGPCDCSEREIDPRLAILATLLDKNEEE